jgi:hypothetical protein
VPVGLATETNTAQALVRFVATTEVQASSVKQRPMKNRPAGQWLGLAPDMPVVRVPILRPVGVAVERDEALALPRAPADYTNHIAILLLLAA